MELAAQAILFDNDGVLVDSHAETEQAWRQLASEYDLDTETLLTELVGVRAVDTLGRHVPPAHLEAAVARLEDLEVELAPLTRPLAGALELLDRLPVGRWTIVTSATHRLASARWRGAGVPEPATVVTAERVTRGKPDPEPFVAGARLLGVDPARCIVFEDSPSGGLAGRASGAAVVAVGDQPWPIDPEARVADLTAVAPRAEAPGADGGGPLRLAIDGPR